MNNIKIYKYSFFLKVVGIICSLILMAFSILILFISVNKDEAFNLYYLFVPLSIFFFLISLLGIKDVIVSKVIISEGDITSINAFSSKKLRKEEIRGFKKGKNYYHVFPKNISKKKLKFSAYLQNKDEILDWLSDFSVNIDLQNQIDEKEEFYSNKTYGFTKKEKQQKLKQATRLTKIINTISVLITLSFFLLKDYTTHFSWLFIGIPIPLIFVVYYFNGLIKLGDKEEDEETIYPSMFWGFSAPIFLGFLVTLVGIDIYDYSSLWIPLLIISISIFALCIFVSKENFGKQKKKYNKLFMLFFVTGAYGYLLIITLNVKLDESPLISYKAKVLSKEVSKGKSTSYYCYLAIPELQKDSDKFSVTNKL